MIPGSQRVRLAADPKLGAGNFLHHVLGQGRDLDEPVLWLDREWRSPPGTVHGQFSLRELKDLVDAHAAWYHGLGVVPRDPVAVYASTAIEVFVHHVALTGLGAIPVLVNGGLEPAVAAEYLIAVRVVGAFADEALAPALARHAQNRLQLRFLLTPADLARLDRPPLPPWYPYSHHASDPVLIVHSSGTTGDPKPVLLQHQNYFYGVRYRLRLPPPDGMTRRILSALPPQHASAIMTLMIALLHGVPIEILSSQRAEVVMAEIERFRPSMVSGFAKTFADLVDTDHGRFDLSSVALWWSTGDAAHESHIGRLVSLGSHYEVGPEGRQLVPGSMVVDSLGSSELAFMHFAKVHQRGTSVPERCLGRPLEFVEAAVLSELGEPLPAYRVGRLGVRSPCLTSGYWNDSPLTWRSQLAGYWLTGDLAYRDDEGQFYHVDRVTDAIETRAGTLYSVLAEELLMKEHADIADCTVIGVPGDDGRTEAVAFLLVRGAPDDAVRWKRRVNEVLTGQGLPPVERLIQVQPSQIPIGVTGKVKKRELRRRWREIAAGAPSA